MGKIASHRKTMHYTRLISILLGLFSCASWLGAESFCIDFRWNPNPANLIRFDFSILDIQSEPDLGPGHAAGKKFYSYLSVGQIAGDAPYLDEVSSLGIRFVAINEEWNSYYPDLSDPRWADYVIHVLAPIAINKGFDGFFLDTVDAVETLGELEPNRASAHRAGMVNLIRGLKAAYPSKQIILNRGFAVFDSVKTSVKGVLIEEMFQRDDYTERSEQGVSQLLARIEPIKQAGFPVYVVDYVSADNLPLADETAERISNLGFHPLIVPQQLHGIVLAPRSPVITSQPQGSSVLTGMSFTFSAGVAGTGPLSYQWRVDGRDIPNAQGSSLSLQNVQRSDAGRYSVFVRNSAGSVSSASAVLNVNPVDSDGDQMPDDWELTQGLNPYDPGDANTDADGDGLGNLKEYLAGTIANDPLSYLQLRISKLAGNDLNLRFQAVAGKSYTVQRRTSLQNSSWMKLQDIDAQTGDRNVNVVYPIGPADTVGFYRIVTPKLP
jgi:endo-alpha-1,4-polygalactosaminidase (GH114 family)